MILTTHAVVGVALTQSLGSSPMMFIMGFLSHYVVDAIPHWHYTVPQIKHALDKSPGATARDFEYSFLPDIMRIAIDCALGLAFGIIFFSGSPVGTISAVSGAVLPDLLVGLFLFYPSRVLRWHFIFHRWMHARTKLDHMHVIGVGLQVGIIISLIWFFGVQ